MFYRKNIYAWEQWGRVVIGLAMLVWGVLPSGGGLLGYGIAAVGVFLGLTGVVGFCPACALVGRKLRDHV
ncbi:DUF2892 domain-containing protein [Devosia sp.]|uniref:YgaP family membrane protein n=1 Tax=Devosia sp. TaxID=1871048 RepID=UPI0032669A12